MEKRGMMIGAYHTGSYGWTLTEWTLSPAEQKTTFVDKPGGQGSWDLSTALTDGLPVYNDRTLTARFELSEGDRPQRENVIRAMVNQLDGMRLHIYLPDDAEHYVIGRVHVAREYNDMAHAAVTVTAVCEPWKYSQQEYMEMEMVDTDTLQSMTLTNPGRLPVVPKIQIKKGPATNVSITLVYGTNTWELGEGTYQIPDILLYSGNNTLQYKGQGMLQIEYNEGAVLE